MTEEKRERPYDEMDNAQILVYLQKYIETWNKTEAYLAVHPESSRPSAMTNTFRYWRNPTLQASLKVIIDDLGIGNDELLAILTSIARGENGTNKANQLAAIKLIMESRGLLLHRTDITTAGEKVSWQQIIENETGAKVGTDYMGGTMITSPDEEKPY